MEAMESQEQKTVDSTQDKGLEKEVTEEASEDKTDKDNEQEQQMEVVEATEVRVAEGEEEGQVADINKANQQEGAAPEVRTL